jgi:hypothetical protein
MPYLLIKVAVDDGVPPAFVAWVRVVLGAAVLLGLAWRARALAGLRGRGRWLAAFAVAEIAVPFPLIAAGERHVDSSLAAILIASAPLFVALLALRFDATERADARCLAGLVVGLAGVVALVGVDIAGRTDEFSGGRSDSRSRLLLRRRPDDLQASPRRPGPAGVNGREPRLDGAVPRPRRGDLSADHGALGDDCRRACVSRFVLYGRGPRVLGRPHAQVGAGRALVVTYVNPVVAVVLGMTILGERPGTGAVAGLPFILAGSWLSTDGRLPRRLERLLDRLPSRTQRADRRTRQLASDPSRPGSTTGGR